MVAILVILAPHHGNDVIALPNAGRFTTSLIAVALVAAACQPDKDPHPPKPDVGYTVEASIGKNQTTFAKIGPAGGQLTAKSGAVTFTLTVPPKALLADASIGMTPIESIGKYPFGTNFAAGVQLSPDGLVLAAPAELVITGGPDPAESAAFQFDGAGDGFHLIPFAGEGVRLQLLHFSGAGYGAATTAEMGSVPAPPRNLDAVQQDAARDPNLHNLARPGSKAALENFRTNAAKAAINDLKAAKQNPGELGAAATNQALALERQLQLLGIPLDEATSREIAGLIQELRNLLNTQLEQDCAKGTGDPVGTAQSLLALERNSQLAGLGETTSTTFDQSFLDCVNSVLTLELSLSYVNDRDWGSSTGWVTYTFTAGGKGELTYQTKDGWPSWVGEIPVDINPFTTTDPKCNGLIVPMPNRPARVRVEAMPNINPLRKPANQTAKNLLIALSPQGGFMVQCPQAQNFLMSLSDGAPAINRMLYPASFGGESLEFFGAITLFEGMKWSVKGKFTLKRSKRS
jgi:hypothetical protein